jgi:hypothetical protein
MALPVDPDRSAALQRQRHSEALALSMSLHRAQTELEAILTELRRQRLRDGGDEPLPEALVLQGARLEAECEQLEAALRQARAGQAGLIHDEALPRRWQRAHDVA